MIKNLIILVLILILIAVVVFLDVPKVQEILALREQISEQKEAFSEKQALLLKIEELKSGYEENKESLEKVSYILPAEQDIPNLIVQLEALAFENGLVLESINLSSSEKTSSGMAEEVRESQQGTTSQDYQILTANLKVIGDYSGFKNFLKAVENNIRLMDVVSLNFSGESGGLGLFRFDITLKTYYQ